MMTANTMRTEGAVIGKAIDRIDGPLKVTGRALYAYEQSEAGKAAYGTILGADSDSVIGDPDGTFAAALVRIDATYDVAYQSHNPMEPHATLAVWEGDRVTLYTSTQTLANVQEGMAATLRIPPGNVRVVSPFIGGGFGSKLIPHAETVLAALAARELRRPVKVVFTRQQIFANAGYRPRMHQHMRLGAGPDGRLVSMTQNVIESTSRFEEFAEQTAVFARSLYAAPNRATRHRLVRLDVNRGEWMRAPGERPACWRWKAPWTTGRPSGPRPDRAAHPQ